MKNLNLLLVSILMIVLASCSSTKNVAYFQNIDNVDLSPSKGLFSAKIMPKDELTITVNTTDREVAAQFNQVVYNTMTSGSRSVGSGQGSLMPFLVDNDGYINFPIVGKVHVLGLTREECQDKIAALIKPYLADGETPIVLVQLSGYHVTVMGEVKSPKVINVTQEKINVLEAITQAGDLTVYGVRDNVLLIREDATGQKHQIRLNLNDANIINSPYYYLQQNDIIYVTPNKVAARNSDIGQSTSMWFSAVGLVMSVASLVINILR